MAVDVDTSPDGSLVIQPHGVLDVADTVELRRTLVRAIRRTRPLRLIVDLSDVHELDSINLGTLVAAYHLGNDHQVAVFLDHCPTAIADQLSGAGIPVHRLRHIGFPPRSQRLDHEGSPRQAGGG